MNNIPKYLYHLTYDINVKSILEHGLEPRIGVHSQFIEDDEESIYLSNFRSLPYWKIFFDNTKLLRIDTDKIDKNALRLFNYELYQEYIYQKVIPPDAISITQSYKKLTPEQLIEFKISLFDTASRISILFARYVTYLEDQPEDAHDDLNECKYLIKIFKYYTECLDFSDIPKKNLNDHLHNMGDGGCTLCDRYDAGLFNFDLEPNRPRLWQLLGTHELATDETKWLYDYLRKTFPRRLRVETGGWTC